MNSILQQSQALIPLGEVAALATHFTIGQMKNF